MLPPLRAELWLRADRGGSCLAPVQQLQGAAAGASASERLSLQPGIWEVHSQSCLMK